MSLIPILTIPFGMFIPLLIVTIGMVDTVLAVLIGMLIAGYIHVLCRKMKEVLLHEITHTCTYTNRHIQVRTHSHVFTHTQNTVTYRCIYVQAYLSGHQYKPRVLLLPRENDKIEVCSKAPKYKLHVMLLPRNDHG